MTLVNLTEVIPSLGDAPDREVWVNPHWVVMVGPSREHSGLTELRLADGTVEFSTMKMHVRENVQMTVMALSGMPLGSEEAKALIRDALIAAKELDGQN